jgi:hypothetical protein
VLWEVIITRQHRFLRIKNLRAERERRDRREVVEHIIGQRIDGRVERGRVPDPDVMAIGLGFHETSPGGV